MTFLCLYISRWWRQTWDTPPYLTVVNQSEARISTEHGIKQDILPKYFPEPRERHTTPPTGGQHCINLHPGHHQMCCWTKHACPMWQGMWHLRYELHAVIATKEKKSINWNLSQYQKTTVQGIPIVIRQPRDGLIENRALTFREWGQAFTSSWDFYWNKGVLKWSTP